jgi:hypothetical protein
LGAGQEFFGGGSPGLAATAATPAGYGTRPPTKAPPRRKLAIAKAATTWLYLIF